MLSFDISDNGEKLKILVEGYMFIFFDLKEIFKGISIEVSWLVV